MKGLREEITRAASELGIDQVGFAALTGPAPGSDRLAEWLGEGRHATMAWMERDPVRRTDPRLLLDGAKTIVCAALNYYTAARHSGRPGAGRISRYAWGEDYHDVLGRKLETLLAALRSNHPGLNGRVCVDSSPVMEKAWGQAAGLGWIGKHTNLISRETGSWFFLGEIVIDAEIEPDVPETDHCGNCTLCIEACPTGAITGPYLLDAGLCIAYLTIEHRGPFPAGEGDLLDGWIFGCDVCQEVCPWNVRAVETSEPSFRPRDGRVELDAGEVMSLTGEEFRRLFRGSPLMRARVDGLRRNAEALRRTANERTSSENDNDGTRP